jgi:penicillin-binding protein-related factor A (putative recombinase)
MKKNSNARNDGTGFENSLAGVLRCYASAGQMRVKKVSQPIKVFGPPGNQRVIHLENPFLDFVGAWTERGGRMIMFEAKSTIEPKLQLGSKLSDNQAASLHLWDVANAVSFLLWEHRGAVRLWTDWMIAEQATEWRHLKFERGVVVPAGLGFVLWDFRKVMLQIWPTT